MALILSDQGLTTENFTDIPDDREPFLYIVNVGQNENESRSCFRQYRFISEMEKINRFGLEMEKIGCDAGSYSTFSCPVINTTPTSHSQIVPVIGVNMIVLGATGAFVLAICVILFMVFKRKCKKRGQLRSESKPYMEISLADRESGGYSLPFRRETTTIEEHM